MTTIPVGSLPQPTTPRSASQSPRLPLSPRAQQVLKNRAKPVPRLVPRVSVMPGAITPEAKSPRTQPASSSATPRSAAASAETTPRTTTPETARRARSELSEQRTAVREADRQFCNTTVGLSAEDLPHASLDCRGKEPAKQLSASAIDPGAEGHPLASLGLVRADTMPKEQSPRFVVPEKRQPHTRQASTGITLGPKSPGRIFPEHDPKLSPGRSETIRLAMEKGGSVKERTKFFEGHARSTTTVAKQPARHTRTEQPGMTTIAKSPPPHALAELPSSDPETRAPKDELGRDGRGEKLQQPPRKPDNFS